MIIHGHDDYVVSYDCVARLNLTEDLLACTLAIYNTRTHEYSHSAAHRPAASQPPNKLQPK